MDKQPIQRRLAAIVAADVVGYSRLMERDETATLAALKERRKSVLEPLVARHKGRIFKFTGDGVLAEFGSAVNAVQCAVELQREMTSANSGLAEERRIVLRIGINLGDIMVEGRDLYGDGVNIAARLEGLAEPGGILVSGTAYDYVRNKVSAGFDDLGAQRLKNIAEPVRAYRVTAAGRVCRQGNRRKALHCRASVYQHEQRSRAGLFRRWLGGRPDHRSVEGAWSHGHRAALHLCLQRQGD